MEQIPTFADDYGMSLEDPYALFETFEREYNYTTKYNTESLESTLSETSTFEIEIQTEANIMCENQFVSSSTTISDHFEFMRSLDSDSSREESVYKTNEVNNHILYCHSRKKKLYKCEVCEKTISNHSNFIIHKRLHTGEKPFQCDVCEKKYSCISNYIVHKRTHTGERPFQCGICKKKFSHRSNCITHIRIHTGEKPFECAFCEQKFSHSSNLKAHKRKHTGEKPFQCYICGKEYTSNNYLKKHILRHIEERR